MKKPLLVAATAVILGGAAVIGIVHTTRSEASDHDDGDNDIKSRALNLTDHFVFKSPSDPSELSFVMYFNPRSLPGRQYFLSSKARYEFHVSKAASKTAAPTAKSDYVFRFEATEPMGDVQNIKLTVLENGAVKGTVDGTSTSFAKSKANGTGDLTVNMGSAGGMAVKFFVGMRADSFYFDVNRFFQVRRFLATRFFGGAGGTGNAGATLAGNCKGDPFLGGILGAPEADGDEVNLWNPPSCAPDFTKNYNVTAIVLNVPISALGGGTVFDTWSTISVKD